jgi:D-xylose 1-dehydrogenase (NADP+, D-xylono-1,5-lactone-forming)
MVVWGFLSTARINDDMLAGARLSDRVNVLAVASRDQRRADDWARERGVERAYGGYEALLADPDVEAVYISLPNSLHLEWAIRALEAGKHVLCEKPLDRRSERVEEAFAVAERADRFLTEGFLYRHHPQTQRLVELVESGAIGELRLIRIAFSFALTELGDVRMRPELDGGALMDVGCYCLSMARLLAGEPESATAQKILGSTGVDVRLVGTLAFGDVLAHFDCGMDLPYRSELEVLGSDGVLRVPDPFRVAAPGLELMAGEHVEWIDVEQVDRAQLQLENFGDVIRGGAEPVLGREDVVGQARALEMLYRASE